jgi:serine/threonine-protein kinase
MKMSPEVWSRIEHIFTIAVELQGDARKQLLDRTCDAEIRAEVDSLLAAHDTSHEFLAEQPWLFNPPDETPERIGPYRVLRAIGRGGMGQVWLVERVEQDFRQTVALKVLRRGLDTDDLLARFRAERQILARLNHPNIARLFDVGATDQGLPFFVMEYVDGVPILSYATSSDVTDRLRLFRTVCDAVQYAHRNLIVHRDIKPGNILVDGDGVPKLLDFGIARILEEDAAIAHTRAEMRLLTPEYSAPEQIRGEPITTACDVHALGILLYELLSGVHPFRRSANRDAVIRDVLDYDPPAPSSQVAAGSPERRRIQGDLDTIVLKALRKEPEARYQSVQSLVDDIDRHVSGRPVLARPASLWYNARKFVTRNAVPVGAAAALFLIVTASSAMTLHQSRLIRAESQRVARERDKAMQSRSFLLDMFGTTGSDQATGDSVTARQLLDRRAAVLAARAKPGDDPEVRADMMNVLAEGYDRLGIHDKAEALARTALDARNGIHKGDHRDVAGSLNLLGWILHEKGSPDEAEKTLRAAVAMGRRLYGANGDGALARALNDLGVQREAQGDYAEATSLYRESLDMRRRLGDDDESLATTTSNLSVVLYRQNDIAGAVKMGQEALAAFGRALGPDHQRTTIVQNNLAAMQSQLGDHAGAAQQHAELVAKRTRLSGPRDASVAYSMTMLANELVMMDSVARAESLLHDATAIQKEAHAPPAQVEATMRVLGDAYERSGRHDLALGRYTEALALTRTALGPTHRDVAMLLARTAKAYEGLGKFDQSAHAYHDAIDAATAAKAGKRALGYRLALIEMLARQGNRDAGVAELPAVDLALAGEDVPADDTLRIVARRARTAILAAVPRGLPASKSVR